jgi:Protein of unknown function (DUF1116)
MDATSSPRANKAVNEPTRGLLSSSPRVINIGLEGFALDLARLGVPVTHVDWRPPAHGDARLAELLSRLDDRREQIDWANSEALTRLTGGDAWLIDCLPAREAFGLRERVVLHAGPPLDRTALCEPMRAAILCAIRYEGWAPDDDSAAQLIERQEVHLAPCHDCGAVGPMTGIISASMPVFVVENRVYGNRAYATINEGLGKVLRFGANDASVVARLRWLAAQAGPLLGAALRASGGIDLRTLMAQALRMGDEMHQRNIAASALLARALMPRLARATAKTTALTHVVEFMAGNDQFFLNLAMAAGKALTDPANGVEHSTLVTAMARNGTEFGIRVSGHGERWFTAPVNLPSGLYFPGFGEGDANPDMGDSAIVETIGLGGCAMAASPAAARFVGAGGMAEALQVTAEMRDICLGAHSHFRIPILDEQGTPVGIDIRAVLETGITPLINTGIAGRKAGTGQIGAGVVRAPFACFARALDAFF